MEAVFYPMGAVTESKKEKMDALWLSKDWIAERKYDGFRYLIRQENGTRVLSRNAVVGTNDPVDKTANVPHIVEYLKRVMLPDGTILDGEIITHENCESHEVTRIMGCDPDKAIARQEEEGYVKYVVFDILSYKGIDLTDYKYYERRKALESVYKNYLSGNDIFILAPVYTENKEAIYEEIVKQGGEGVMLKNIHATYQISLDAKKPKKPKDTWVKVKKYDTYDVVVIGFTEPTKEYGGKELETWPYWIDEVGNPFYRQNQPVSDLLADGFVAVTKDYYMDWIGAIEFGQYRDGELIRIGKTDGIADKIKLEIYQKGKEYFLNTVMEVGAMRQNKKSGALVHPRFLRWRDDKPAEACILGQK